MSERSPETAIRPWRPKARQMPDAVRHWLDGWALAASGRLSQELRRASGTDVVVKIERVGETSGLDGARESTQPLPLYRALVESAGSSPLAATLRAESWQCPVVALVSQDLGALIVELMLGGGAPRFGKSQDGRRNDRSSDRSNDRTRATAAKAAPPTALSLRLLQRFVSLTASSLGASVKPAPEFRTLAVGTVDDLPRVMDENEPCVALQMQVSVQGLAGVLTLICPAVAVERAIRSAKAQRPESGSVAEAATQAMAAAIADVAVEVVAQLGTAKVAARCITELKIGDVIRLDKGQPELTVEGRPKFIVEVAADSHGMKAVRIARLKAS